MLWIGSTNDKGQSTEAEDGNMDHSFSTWAKFSKKTNISYLPDTHAYVGVSWSKKC